MASTAAGAPSRLVLSESKWLRLFSMTVFYFAQGLPIGLYLTAVAAWIAQNGASASDVAFLVTTTYLPWSFKFFAAAAMDRFTYLPMGRRRIWLIGSQGLMVVGLLIAALVGPGPTEITLLAIVGFAIFCGSAVQDVAVDGMAVDILPDEDQGIASSFMFAGQALGIAIGAALGGFMLNRYGTSITFLGFLPLVGTIFLLAVILRERPGEKLLPWTAGEASPFVREVSDVSLWQIAKITFFSMIKRDSLLYMISSIMVRATAGIFLAFWPLYAVQEAGWTTESYSAFNATEGLAVAGAGVALGVLMNATLGPRRSSILSAGMWIVVAALFIARPELGLSWGGFVALFVLGDLGSLLYTICTNPLRMRLSDKRVAATQFTIYNSLANIVVPAGAWLLALTTDHGGRTVTMGLVIALTAIGMVSLLLLRMGDVVDKQPEDDMVPRVD